MSLFKSMKTLKKEAQISDLFPVTHLNSPSVFESKNGLLGSVIRVQGVPFEVESPSILNHKAQLLHQALNLLDEHFLVYITTHRQKAECQLNGKFQSAFARMLDARYHDRFKDKPLYTNTLYLTIILKGDTSDKKSSLLTWAKTTFNKKIRETRQFERTIQMDKLALSQKFLYTMNGFILGEFMLQVRKIVQKQSDYLIGCVAFYAAYDATQCLIK